MALSRRDRQISGVIKLAVGTAGLLTLLKIVAGVWTQSLAILASALDSLMDVASSSVNFFANKAAAKPPDTDHKYGHAKIESLVGLFQSLFFILIGLFIVWESLKRLFLGSFVREIHVGLAVMIISILLTVFLVWRIHHVSHRYQSIILKTEHLHYSMDILTNVAVMLTLVLVQATGLGLWDIFLSLLVSGYIFRNAFKILRASIDELLDRSVAGVSEKEIETLISQNHPKIVGIHDFRSRRVGPQIFLDFHVEIRNETNFRKAHKIAESLVEEIKARYHPADVTVHYDPEGAD